MKECVPHFDWHHNGAGSGGMGVVSWPEGMTAGEVTLPPASGGIRWPSHSNPEEFALVMQIN